MNPHNIIRRDPDGREVVGMWLSNHHRRAWLYREDFDRIVGTFGTQARAYVNDNGRGALYVRLKYPTRRNNVQVARLVAGDRTRTAISYVDGDRLNLRSLNLLVGTGSGGCRKRRRRTATAAAGTPHAEAFAHA